MSRSLTAWWPHVITGAIIVIAAAAPACSRSNDAALQQAQLAALQQTQRAEAERLEALRLEAERARQEQQARERRDQLAKMYARAAGRQIMSAIGGGQDLIVRSGEWTFDTNTTDLEIPVEVSFNGLIIRSNNYRVSGLLTVREDGGNPRFARLTANENYIGVEDTLTALAITAAGVMVLSDLNTAPSR